MATISSTPSGLPDPASSHARLLHLPYTRPNTTATCTDPRLPETAARNPSLSTRGRPDLRVTRIGLWNSQWKQDRKSERIFQRRLGDRPTDRPTRRSCPWWGSGERPD